MNTVSKTEHIPRPRNSGVIFQTFKGPHFEYCEIVSSRKNKGRPIRMSIITNAITNAPEIY